MISADHTAVERTMTARVVAFGRALREAGLGVTTSQVTLFLDALAVVGVTDRIAFHDAARTSLVSRAEEIEPFETAFARFWTRGRGAGANPNDDASRGDQTPPRDHATTTLAKRPHKQALVAEAGVMRRPSAPDPDTNSDADADDEPLPVLDHRQTWSAADVLRRKRFDRLDADEMQQVRDLMRTLTWRITERRTRRFRRASHGTHLDWRRMVQRAVRDQGEWVERRWRARRHAPRPLVVLADISGSMEAYSRLLLYFLHGVIQRAPVSREPSRAVRALRSEAFVFATRLTRITRALQRRDVDAALARVSAHVVDWAGGTRIGECLHVFNREWARRVLGRGAVVLVISDAWDRGDPELFAREVNRLAKSCHRLIWLNPLIATDGYEPRTRGLVAALPFIDDFLPAHNLASLEDLARHLERLPAAPSASSRRGTASTRP